MSIGLFVDGSFIYKSFYGEFDYLKLRQFLESDLGDTIDEAYFFNADDDPPKAAKFNHSLTLPPPRGPGLRLKIYWLTRKKLYWPKNLGGFPVMNPKDPTIQFELVQQKGVDVGLAFHLIRSFSKRHWTKLVLCAGDGDFHEPVQSLVESENVELYLVGTMPGISQELRPYAKKIYEIDQEPLRSKFRRGFVPQPQAVLPVSPVAPAPEVLPPPEISVTKDTAAKTVPKRSTPTKKATPTKKVKK